MEILQEDVEPGIGPIYGLPTEHTVVYLRGGTDIGEGIFLRHRIAMVERG